MGTGECGKYKFTCIWLTRGNFHPCHAFIYLTNVAHIGKIKFRINALGEHIHCKCDNIHISCTLTVSKQRSLDTISSCEDAKLCITDAGAAVIMRVKGKNHIFSVAQMFVEILYLACKYMRHCIFPL